MRNMVAKKPSKCFEMNTVGSGKTSCGVWWSRKPNLRKCLYVDWKEWVAINVVETRLNCEGKERALYNLCIITIISIHQSSAEQFPFPTLSTCLFLMLVYSILLRHMLWFHLYLALCLPWLLKPLGCHCVTLVVHRLEYDLNKSFCYSYWALRYLQPSSSNTWDCTHFVTMLCPAFSFIFFSTFLSMFSFMCKFWDFIASLMEFSCHAVCIMYLSTPLHSSMACPLSTCMTDEVPSQMHVHYLWKPWSLLYSADFSTAWLIMEILSGVLYPPWNPACSLSWFESGVALTWFVMVPVKNL